MKNKYKTFSMFLVLFIISYSAVGQATAILELKSIKNNIFNQSISCENLLALNITNNKELNKSFHIKENKQLQQLKISNVFESKTNNRPYWFLGFTATALGVTGLILNKSAKNNYLLYLDETDNPTLRKSYYGLSNNRKKASETLMGASAGFFVLNFIVIISK